MKNTVFRNQTKKKSKVNNIYCCIINYDLIEIKKFLRALIQYRQIIDGSQVESGHRLFDFDSSNFFQVERNQTPLY